MITPSCPVAAIAMPLHGRLDLTVRSLAGASPASARALWRPARARDDNTSWERGVPSGDPCLPPSVVSGVGGARRSHGAL